MLLFTACIQTEKKELKISSADLGGHIGDSMAITWVGRKCFSCW